MQSRICPICEELMEVRDVAPCYDCGGSLEEIEHFQQGRHTFAEYEVFPSLNLVLCNFCDVDFGSYQPEFFGLRPTAKFGFPFLRKVRDIELPSLGKDLFCSHCNMRSVFLKFAQRARQLHAG